MMKTYIKIAHYLAHSFHRTTNLDYDDIFQEALLGYLEAKDTFDPNKGMVLTYMFTIMKNKVINFVKKEIIYKKKFPDTPIPDKEYKQNLFFEFWETLSEPSKTIAKIVLENKKEILQGSILRIGKKIVKRELSERGFTTYRIRKNFKQIQHELSIL